MIICLCVRSWFSTIQNVFNKNFDQVLVMGRRSHLNERSWMIFWRNISTVQSSRFILTTEWFLLTLNWYHQGHTEAILRLLLNIVSYFIFSCRKISRSNQRQIKRSKKGGQTMVIRTVQTVHSRLHKCPLDSDWVGASPGNHVTDWDDLYFDYLEYVAEKPVVYGKTIYWNIQVNKK